MLRSALENRLVKEKISAHMPGHKYLPLHATDWFKLDTTEITGTDNLHASVGILKESMDFCARLYGARSSHFLINGSTVGILSAILGSTKRHQKILIGRDSHQSVYHAVEMNNLNEIVVNPVFGTCGQLMGYAADEVVSIIESNLDLKVVVLTSPTYYGYTTNLQPIVQALKKRKGILIVDEAHGAHLNFGKTKNYCALTMGAHIVVQSAHKTLPAMTQTGIIHFAQTLDGVIESSIRSYLLKLQSSSPSYVLLCSIDDALHYMVAHQNEYDTLYQFIKSIRLNRLSNWVSAINPPQDLFKLWLETPLMGYTGYDVAQHLENHGIVVEFSHAFGTLLYLSALNTESDLLTICDVLGRLEQREALYVSQSIMYPKPIRRMTREDMVEKSTTEVFLDQAIGRVCAQRVVPYPPGVPLIVEGELIQQDHIQLLKTFLPYHKSKIRPM